MNRKDKRQPYIDSEKEAECSDKDTEELSFVDFSFPVHNKRSPEADKILADLDNMKISDFMTESKYVSTQENENIDNDNQKDSDNIKSEIDNYEIAEENFPDEPDNTSYESCDSEETEPELSKADTKADITITDIPESQEISEINVAEIADTNNITDNVDTADTISENSQYKNNTPASDEHDNLSDEHDNLSDEHDNLNDSHVDNNTDDSYKELVIPSFMINNAAKRTSTSPVSKDVEIKVVSWNAKHPSPKAQPEQTSVKTVKKAADITANITVDNKSDRAAVLTAGKAADKAVIKNDKDVEVRICSFSKISVQTDSTAHSNHSNKVNSHKQAGIQKKK